MPNVVERLLCHNEGERSVLSFGFLLWRKDGETGSWGPEEEDAQERMHRSCDISEKQGCQ